MKQANATKLHRSYPIIYYLRLWETLGLKGANLIQLLLQSFLVPTAGEPLHLSFFG